MPGISRQSCVFARAGLILLRPRLGGVLRTSGRLLEAWRRVAPSVHYAPMPYGVFLLMMQYYFENEYWDMAMYLWLSFHCFAPGKDCS